MDFVVQSNQFNLTSHPTFGRATHFTRRSTDGMR